MIGISIELLISWVLLRLIFRENLAILGFMLSKKKLVLVISGFLLPLIYHIVLQLSIAAVVENPFIKNQQYSFAVFANTVWFIVKGVLVEELLFRGAILLLIIRKWNLAAGLCFSAFGFGIYHWFSYGVFGQPAQMITVLLSTGLMGLLFAQAFYKAKTIWMPIALHFGYNFTSMVVFSMEKNTGSQFFVKKFILDPIHPEGVIPLLLLILYYVGFPLLCFLFLRSIKEQSQQRI
ncbi:CPBP family intramembrane glutamic endopeptidase [Pedobacter duraquae]|uniref:CAAX prenyl protease 2/Lysostaphin resistance protein A-like domain-containing protein n=1 Tax=Pedobacter duraquae TaxID=425511 RepID=A0A4R6INT1_9SPHI|nr:CPBP family intramembrane glutamic endopeptidase [Pedobacter duraquae]TDO23924.1 hypothetical protein CLV32_0210 [Pedobacter duraquae]